MNKEQLKKIIKESIREELEDEGTGPGMYDGKKIITKEKMPFHLRRKIFDRIAPKLDEKDQDWLDMRLGDLLAACRRAF